MPRVSINAANLVRSPYTLLVVAIAALLFVWPLIESNTNVDGDLGGRILFAVILAAGAYANAGNRRRMILIAILGLPPLALNLSEAVGAGGYAMLELVLSTIFLIYTTGTILARVLTTSRVTADTISGGIAVYFLMALIFALLFTICETATPGSFQLPDSVSLGERIHMSQGDGGIFVYFSLITLTTLGYGDILPLTATARAIVGVESTIGQLYLTVLVARLVGLHVTSRRD